MLRLHFLLFCAIVFANSPAFSTGAVASWSPIAPLTAPPTTDPSAGVGRVNVFRIHPTVPTTMFAGTPGGGLWVTTNSGVQWYPSTDNLPNLGVSDLAFDPTDPGVMYLATGDRDWAGNWGNPYSIGVMKTTNGGTSWGATGLSFTLQMKNVINQLLIDPVNHLVMMACVGGATIANRGIWRTSDGGTTWTHWVGDTIPVYTMAFKPGNLSIVYASGYGSFWKSLDTGKTWTFTTPAPLPTFALNGVTRTAVAVTAGNPSVVYMMYAKGASYNGMYKSTDDGGTWTHTDENFTNISPENSDHNLVLAISPTDENFVVAGGSRLYVSTNTGTSWSEIGSAIHRGHHLAMFSTGSGAALWDCNDGGLCRSTNVGQSWQNLSSTLQIQQLFRISGSMQDSSVIYMAAKDNGVQHRAYGKWTYRVAGTDGSQCVVDYLNDSYTLMADPGGNIYGTSDAGASIWLVRPDSICAPSLPIVYDPVDHTIAYAAYKALYKSVDNGLTWSATSAPPAGSAVMRAVAVAQSNHQVIYMGSSGKLFRSDNGGGAWTDITSTLPIADNTPLTAITVQPRNEQVVWITVGGYANGSKVFKSINGGVNWTNVSGTLPNYPVNCIVYQHNSPDALYIGTDVGIYVRDSVATDWVPYNSYLPNVCVNDLTILDGPDMIRAATFGRGAWESPVRGSNAYAATVLTSPNNLSICTPTSAALQWTAVPTTPSYRLQIGTAADFIAPLIDTVLKNVTQYTDNNGINEQKYFWRVRAEKGGLTGPWSPTWQYTVTAAVPQITGPVDSLYTNDTLVVFTWNVAPHAKRYRVQFSTTKSFSSLFFTNATDTTVSQVFGRGQTIYWRVAVADSQVCGPQSEVRMFRVRLSALPSKVLLNYPKDDTIPSYDSTNGLPVFWTTSQPGVAHYQLYVFDLNQFNVAFNDSTITANTFNLHVTPGDEYYWLVRARNAEGWGDWSDTGRFLPGTPRVGIGDIADAPQHATLQIAPNPFVGSTNAVITLDHSSSVVISIVDVLGREVSRVYEGTMSAGSYSLSIGVNLPGTQVYFCRVSTSKTLISQIMMKMR